MSTSSTIIVSKSTIYPDQESTLKPLKLSVSDLPMLSCHYTQKGLLLTAPPYSFEHLILTLKYSLSVTLSLFPPLAGRLTSDPNGYVYITCNDAGVDFIHAEARHLTLNDVVSPSLIDVHPCFKEFFAYDMTISYSGHHVPLLAVQVTELADAVFIGCSFNHAVTDGTSLWHFINTFASVNKDGNCTRKILSPNFSRETIFNSDVILPIPVGGPTVTFIADKPLRERVLHFSSEAIKKLKQRANIYDQGNGDVTDGLPDSMEVMGKDANDGWRIVNRNGDRAPIVNGHQRNEVSSFQSLCAQLWRSVIRARKLDTSKMSTFRMAVNCRGKLEPKMDPFYFGNAIQSIPTVASVGDIISRDLRFCAELLHKNVLAHDDAKVRRGVEDWEKAPRMFTLGNFDGGMIIMGGSPRFAMYDNDFGWGKPLAIRSGKTKFDGRMYAFPGREGNGSVDLEVVLDPETMAALENDMEFMQYVS